MFLQVRELLDFLSCNNSFLSSDLFLSLNTESDVGPFEKFLLDVQKVHHTDYGESSEKRIFSLLLDTITKFWQIKSSEFFSMELRNVCTRWLFLITIASEDSKCDQADYSRTLGIRQ